MIASKPLKALVAALAGAALVSASFAQGNPPNSAVTNPAQGAGQQSSQGTSMGTTGTQTQSGTTAAGKSSASTSMGAGSTPAAPAATTSGSGTMSASADTGTTMAKAMPKKKAKKTRAIKKDRS